MAAKQDFLFPPQMPGYHVYQGVNFPPIIPTTNLDAMKTWQVRSDDIFCITYPKSGSHWIIEIVGLIVNGGDPSKIDRSHMAIAAEVTTALVTDLDAIKKVTPGYKLMESWESPRVILTHLHEQFLPPDAFKKKVKMVYLARNPKDVFCSTASFSLPFNHPDFRDIEYFIKFYLLSDQVAMGTWFQHVLGYIKHHNDDNFLFVKYEDLHKDLVGEVKRIAKFLDRPLSDELAEKIATLSSMKEMRKAYDKHEEEHPEGIMHTRAFGMLKFLNKGKVGTWKDTITGDLNELFDKVYKEKMADSGLQFDFEV